MKYLGVGLNATELLKNNQQIWDYSEFDPTTKASQNIREDSTKKIVVEVRSDDPINPEIGRIWFINN